MALTVDVGTPLPLVSGSAESNSIDVGTNPEALVVYIATGATGGKQSFITVTVGGQALSYVHTVEFIGRNVYLFENLAPSAMSGSQTFEVTLGAVAFGTTPYAIAYALHGGGSGIWRVGGSLMHNASAAADMYLDFDGPFPGLAIVAGRGDSVAGFTPQTNTTEDKDSNFALFGHETTPTTGTRAVGWTGAQAGAFIGAMYIEAPAAIEISDSPGAEGGIPDSYEVTQGDPVIFAHFLGIAGGEAGIPSGFTISAEGPAQVALGVPGHDRPQWTERRSDGGPAQEGDTITYHTARKPTWEEPSGGADWRDPTTLLSDLTASGATSIDRDDAATHYLELDGNITITPTDTNPPGAGHDIDMRALILGDGSSTLAFGGTITWATADGMAPAAPDDDELLVIGFHSIDDGTTWLGFVADGGSTSVGALDDLTDVSLTSETEGDTLRYRSGEWVNEAFPGVSAGRYEVVMVPGVTAPPEPLLNMDESDWVYGLVP